jgi:hypothetical protein
LLEIWVQAICQDVQIFLERNSFLFGRKPDMTSIRMPQKRGGGFGNLGEAIRRMQEQGGMGMPREGVLIWVCQEWKADLLTNIWVPQAELLDFTII